MSRLLAAPGSTNPCVRPQPVGAAPTTDPRPTLRRAFLLSLVSLCATSIARSAHADETASLLAAIANARKNVRTLVAGIEQRRHLGLLSTDVTSRGELTVVLPDRLRWELFAPDSIRVWVGSSGVAYDTADASGRADKSAVGALASVLDDLLIAVGGNPARLRERYALTASRAPAGAVRIDATSLAEAGAPAIRRVRIELDADLVVPRTVRLTEADGDWSRILFERVRVNVPVDPARMRPPPRR